MTTVWGEVEGRAITFPMVVEELHAATLLYSVPSAAAAALLPGHDFEVIETTPGTAQFVLAACDYRRNPWGDYLELNFGFLVRVLGWPDERSGSFVYRMPVDQPFTCAAGNRVMGFPKTVEDMAVAYRDDEVTFRLATSGGELTCRVTVPRAPADGDPPSVETESFSYLDGEAWSTRLVMQMGTGYCDPATVRVEVGAGPLADELRSLGLPDLQPDLCTWGEGMQATFEHPQPLRPR